MKAVFKKYRIIAYTLLIVLGLNVVMPAAVLAAGYYCDVKSDSPGNAVNSSVDCCTVIEVNSVSGLFGNQDSIDYCTFLQDCNQSISDPFTELDSLLPVEKKIKVFIAAFPFFNMFQYAGNGWNKATPISLDSTFPYSAPPIFLVNSTFLN